MSAPSPARVAPPGAAPGSSAPASTARSRLGFGPVVTLLSAGHFCSHFFQLLLPSLFPLLKPALGLSYAELGLAMTVLYATSGVMQTLAGFVVDRFGAVRVLIVGLMLLVSGVALVASLPGLPLLLLAAFVVGLGNSVFHPCDYALLGRLVTPARLGRAYALHAMASTLGYAAAPATMLALGSALPVSATLLWPCVVPLLVAAALLWQRGALEQVAHEPLPHPLPIDHGTQSTVLSRPVLSCFAFVAFAALPSVGTASFLAPTLAARFGTPLSVVALGVALQQTGSAFGNLLGGWLSDRGIAPLKLVLTGLMIAAVTLLVGGQWAQPAPVLVGLLGITGLAMGMTTPSRDVLVRRATQHQRAGRVFGFVYSGYDLGAALSPLLLALLLEAGATAWVVPVLMAGIVGMVVAALLTGTGEVRPMQASDQAAPA